MMNLDKMAIICNGKEIAYGFNFLHLLNYKSEDEHFMCKSFADGKVDIYSLETFNHSNISGTTLKIFYGNTQALDASYTKVFDEYGIRIYKSGLVYVVKADDKNINGSAYDTFLVFANKEYNKFYSEEKSYVDKVDVYDKNWVRKEFSKEVSSGLFGRKKLRLIQLYDCAAYVLFDLIMRDNEV